MRNKTFRSPERISIVLPNRVGDAILSLPLILCLQELAAAFGPTGSVVEAVTYSPLVEVFGAVGITDVIQMKLGTKLKSWLAPPDKAFFLIATSKNFGFHARSTYGLRQQNKLLVRYKHDLKCLRGEPLPADLDRYLTVECRLPRYCVQQFGVILELGYSVEQVLSTFSFSRQSLPIDRSRLADEQTETTPYLVYCMEAAYGKGRHNAQRRWVPEHHLALAKLLREKHCYRIAFIGLASDPPIPEQDGFLDLRGSLSLWQLFKLIACSAGYVGNDTGPLHLANLAGIPSVGIYSSEDHHAPLFSELNSVVMRPAGPDDVFPSVQRMVLATGAVRR